MPRILRHYASAQPLLVLSVLLLLMSLPGGQGSLWNYLRPTVSAATTFTVNSTGDGADNNPGDGVCNDGSGACTLRAAIQEASAASGADTINFSLAANSTITLSTQLPSFIGNFSIVGPGASLLTIQRSSAPGTPIFQIFSFAAINGNFNDSVSGLTISNGNATGPFSSNMSGGGIFNNFGSALTLTDVVISGSTSTNGGGLYNGGTATLTNCKLTGNNSPNGGGIFNNGTLTMTNSTVSGNSAPNGAGGGIVNSGGTLNITSSTVSGNFSDAQGAGIINKNVFSTPGVATLTNSTVSGNNATGLLASGEGAIANFPGGNTLTLTNATITGNTAAGSGGAVGGILNGSGSTANVRNSIVAKNSSSLGFHDLNGTFNSQGFNLIGESNGTEGFTNGNNSDQVGTYGSPLDPKIGVLSDNGGPTKTHALLVGSPAIDAGNSTQTTDQRGQPRPIDDQTVVNAAGGNASDIGAYEAHNLEVNSTADTDDGLCRAPGTGNGCTLREAINAANTEVGAELITFAPALTSSGPATIVLLTALPSVSSDMTINGPGANLLTVQRSTAGGTPDFRVFTINSGKTVTIALLSISNGSAVSVFIDQATVLISNCVVKDATSGGGIYNFSGSLVINDSTISGNSGTGISNTVPVNNPSVSPATVTINNSSISGNAGSGVYNSVLVGNAASPATVTINNSTISGNNINTSANAAGVRNSVGTGGTATVTINNSTVSSNVNSSAGTGGIYNAAVFNGPAPTIATVTVTNSTIFGNTAGSGTGASGGISNFLNSCTGCNNTIRLCNTVVARNFRDSGATASDISDGVDPSSSFNLIGTGGSGGLTNSVNNNQVGVADPRLGPLSNNGGPTTTHALLAGSPALDAGNNTFVANPPFSGPPFTDQRGTGFARIVDGPDGDTTETVDIGAFEAQVSVADIADQTINEDGSLSLLFNVGGSASITSVTATSSNTSLVPNTPASISISGSGSSRTLLINPIANEFGGATVTVTVNGNNSQMMTDTFVLNVNSVNDVPSFTKGPDQTVIENEGAQTINNWATSISVGPPNESSQTVTFSVVNSSNPSLFAVAPAISLAGTLTYTPATGVSGTALITIALMDNGGTANGGADTSATQSFNINVLEGGTLAFSTATYSVAENSGSAAITFTRSGGSAGTATVLFATSNGTATAGDYSSVSQTISFNDGELSKTVSVAITDDLFKEPDETVNLTLSNVSGSGELGAQATALLTIVDDDPVGGYLRFSSANFNTTESSGSTTITVERVGDTSQAVTVGYATVENGLSTQACATANGFASSRCDFTTALGTLHFAADETSKTFAVLISQDSYVEGPETLTLSLSNPTGGAAFATPSNSVLTIADDATEPATNPIDNVNNFVRQHYLDFLNREPDALGLAYWSNQITECQQPGATCDANLRRINVSAAFFVSIEFQETGYLVERLYKAAYGDADGLSKLDTFPNAHPIKVPIVRLNEFLADSQEIGKGLVVGQPGWDQVLENNKVAFIQAFMQRSRFTTAFAASLTPDQFVDMLFANAGVTPTAAERTAAINEFGGAATSADTAARGRALRLVAENGTLNQNERNRAFVLMQYFAYLRRNPDDPQDTDHTGYDFWLTKLNQFDGNFVNAQMVEAFIVSIEYRARFGP